MSRQLKLVKKQNKKNKMSGGMVALENSVEGLMFVVFFPYFGGIQAPSIYYENLCFILLCLGSRAIDQGI